MTSDIYSSAELKSENKWESLMLSEKVLIKSHSQPKMYLETNSSENNKV